MPCPKFCACGPGILLALADSREFPSPSGCRAGSDLPRLLLPDISDRMVGFDRGHRLGLMCGGVEYGIERTVDLLEPERHPAARDAKDLAAAGVLIASLCSFIVGDDPVRSAPVGFQ